MNPARSLGPDVINRSFPGYHWIYWVGPLLGSLLACAFYRILCFVRWEKINPGQDYNEWEARARKDSMAPSERTMTDQVHSGNVPGQHQPDNGPEQRQPSEELLPDQQV